MENTYDVIIVGAGPAGMTAAIYAIRANMKVLMLDRLSPGGAIINTTSVNADNPKQTLLPYATTKGAIQNFTGGLAQLLAERACRQ